MEQENPYQTPEAELLVETPSSSIDVPYYIVGKKKAWILFIATLGVYQVYWFYQHWKAVKSHEESKIWPVPRAIFTYFFCHSLFRKINDSHQKSGRISSWNPSAAATTYVICTLLSSATDRISDKLEGYTGAAVLIFGLIATLISIQTMISAQTHINDIAEDADLDLNESLTWGNYIWIFIGVVLWLLLFAGIAITVNPALFES